MKLYFSTACVLAGIVLFLPLAQAQVINCTPSNDPWARGYCSKNEKKAPGLSQRGLPWSRRQDM